jgi:hypothetical protein
LPLSSSDLIALGALVISITSLIISLFHSRHSRQIEFIKKKTELLSLLCEEELKLNKAKWNFEKINAISPNCYQKTENARKRFLGLIDVVMGNLQAIYTGINHAKKRMDIKRLHELVPEIKKHQLACSELLKDTEQFKDKCVNCNYKEEAESLNCDPLDTKEKT